MRPVPPTPRIDLLTDDLSPGPWVFGRQVAPASPEPEAGALVEVVDRSGRFIGHGLFNPASDIRVRFLSRGRKTDIQRPREFLQRKLASADRIRRKLLALPEVTNAYRIVHAEGDDLSGLMVDRLGDTIVCEHHALGFWRLRADVEWVLGQLYPGLQVVHKVPRQARKLEAFEPEEEPRDVGEVVITEHGLDFIVEPGRGHKTGWFCDQRDNRQLVARLARGHDVLDLCCNGGGFALHAKRAGAGRVLAVDLDEDVLALARKSAQRGGLDVTFEHADAFDVMRRIRAGKRHPGVVVLDPHKLITGKQRMEEGQRKYLDMNALALGCTAPGGLLATFSCSGVLDLAGFLGIVFQAARRAERTIRILSTLGAAPDHPQRPDFSRSRYLKGALLAVD